MGRVVRSSWPLAYSATRSTSESRRLLKSPITALCTFREARFSAATKRSEDFCCRRCSFRS